MAHRLSRALLAPVALTAVALLTSCTAPIGTSRSSSSIVFAKLSASALDGSLSAATQEVLHRYDLSGQFKRDPEAALKWLHAKACADDRRDLLYALAELNYQHGERLQRSVKPGQPKRAPDFFLTAAIYAWFYLLGDGPEPPPTPFDERFRVSCNLYNLALARGFQVGPATNSIVKPENGTRHLAPGDLTLRLTESASNSQLTNVEKYLPANEFLVHGLNVRNRQSGLGAPLIAVDRKQPDSVLAGRQFPVTLVLRASSGGVQAWSRGELTASLEFYSAFETNHIQVGEQKIPLENDTTAPLANRLNSSLLWKLGSMQFFSSEERVKSDLYSLAPYQRGQIPVIFVHGTFSSPVWWAEMLNTLDADPLLRKRFQFWYFIYNSGNPVTYSAANLRAAIQEKLRQLDPTGADPALQQMVVIGHSQGGLLAKLTATDTGSQLWHAISDQNFDTLPLPPMEREELRECLFFKPLPCVKRVVFISTPHRGSYRNSQFVQRFLRRFMTLPGDVVRGAGTLFKVLKPTPAVQKMLQRTAPNSLDGMSTSNPMMLKLAEIPLAPGVKSDSIIAVRGNGPIELGNDGVVSYTSAHLDYADSEFIVRSGHSCQDKAPTIEEVRRILREHLAQLPPP